MEYSFKKNALIDSTGDYDTYWEGLEEGEFRLCRCTACKVWIWPVIERCGACGSWDREWIAVEPTGVVWGWSRIRHALDGMEHRKDDIPYVVVSAAVGGPNGPKVLGVLKGSEDGLKVGAPVRGTIDPPSPSARGYAAIRWSIV
jgi:uncharacterized OB-fold protein